MTYIIKLKKSADVIRLADDRGKIVKDKWMDEDGDTKIDLGSWSGRLSSIDIIVYESEIQTNFSQTEELSPVEQLRADSARDRLNSWMKDRAARASISTQNLL